MLTARSLLLSCVLVAGACASPQAVAPILPEVPGQQAKCRVAASQTSPLVTEWPASEKANLEALLRTGAVAVSYAGCSMRVLPQCRVRGSYMWQRTTLSSDTIEINNQDELYAKLPLGAASLEGELRRSGSLLMRTHVSGQLQLAGATAADVPSQGACAQATHVVGALSVGAFTLSRGASASARAGADVVSVGEASAGTTRSVGVVHTAGDPQACEASTDQAPYPGCSSPIQVFLWPIPGRVAEQGPPGTVNVDFIAASANQRWDVYIDDRVVCTTPCSLWVDPTRPVFMRTRADAPDKIRLTSLGPQAAAGDVQLLAHGTSQGKLVTGITFTTLGGMAAITGVTLGSVGCLAGKSDGMCRAGMISLGAGAVVTAGAIWLILDALPRAELVVPYQTSFAAGAARVRIGPGFVRGSF